MSGTVAPASRAAGELVAWAAAALDPVSRTARLDAELLLAVTAGWSRAKVLARPERQVDRPRAEHFAHLVSRRRGGEPVAYIVGSKEFFSLMLSVSPAVLVPRPETELVVAAALERVRGKGARVLDLGTGSGAIALALKHARPDIDVTGIELVAGALALARANANTLGIPVRFLESDWFARLGGEVFDLILANPPYVASDDPAFATELRHEPRTALDGGADGLDAYRAILAGAGAHLAPDGSLLFEHGADQREALGALAAAAGFTTAAALDDLAGVPRVLVLERSPAAPEPAP